MSSLTNTGRKVWVETKWGTNEAEEGGVKLLPSYSRLAGSLKLMGRTPEPAARRKTRW